MMPAVRRAMKDYEQFENAKAYGFYNGWKWVEVERSSYFYIWAKPCKFNKCNLQKQKAFLKTTGNYYVRS